MILTNLFKGIFDSSVSVIDMTDFIMCMAVSVIIGVIIAVAYMFRGRYTKSFVITLALLPCVVCVVIMMVNGNVGAGVAVAGAFSLVRFRSVPGTAKEICTLFLAMTSGLIAGMGYLGYALLFTVILVIFFVIFNISNFGAPKGGTKYKSIRITVPEDLDYTDIFTEVLAEYTISHELTMVKTTNMGSMFRLTYDVVLRDPSKEKELIDCLRCRNGNLEIQISNQVTLNENL